MLSVMTTSEAVTMIAVASKSDFFSSWMFYAAGVIVCFFLQKKKKLFLFVSIVK